MEEKNTPVTPSPETLSPLKRALIALQELRGRLESAESAKREPIAIVGAGCRFPGGAVDLESYWRLLHDGVDAISEIPAERWDVDFYYDPDPKAPGKMATRSGGFLPGVDQFDPNFFGISPREATSMDPQQRLLLEVAWEALENAGIPVQGLMRSRTGVFAGICSNDYLRQHLTGPEHVDAYISSGNAHSVAAGRLSYTFGLQGPCLAVDTACSSSLVAVHLAVQSLRLGECDLALAGGVNLILAPDGTVALSQAQMLAPDGRCRAFDAAAAGYGRSEGCGVIVLKRLSEAERCGDRVLAVIRGSAVNQDGRSNGLTAPNGLAQQEVIRAALANAGVQALEVGYVEAHGTGTALGDPMEIDALQAVLCQGRSMDAPLLAGSAKTNLGHLETAAGVAGLIKTVLALGHREIPPHLHLRHPSPHIPWARLPIAIPTEPTPWAGRRVAGLSSFGYSGTNAHLVLEAAPERAAAAPGVERTRQILTISARHPESLRALADGYRQLLSANDASLPRICYSANTGRSHLAFRLVVTGSTAPEVAEKLRLWTLGETPGGLRHREHRGDQAPNVAFLFSGQGSQYAGMGRQLYETQPVFRATFERCAEILQPLLGRPLLGILFGDETALLDQTEYTQPALFAIEYALAEMWRAWGIQPAALLGHSVGEYVAACVAGVFSLEDGLKLIAERGKLMQQLASDGAMAAVFAAESTVRAAIAEFGNQLSIAAINGPAEVVISGERRAVELAVAALQESGIRAKALRVSQAFHSALLEPMLGAFARKAAEVRYSAPKLVVISNVTGRRAEAAEIASPAYWVRQAREAVRFADGVQALAEEQCQVFLEIGPKATLLALTKQNLPGVEAAYCASLRPEQDDWSQALDSASALYVQGCAIDWAAVDNGFARSRVDVPLYPFHRQRYWPQASPAVRREPRDRRLHPLLEARLTLPLREQVFEAYLHPGSPAYLADHRIQGVTVVPGAVAVELALAAAAEAMGPGPHVLYDVRFEEPLVLADGEGESVDIVLSPDGFQIFRRVRGETNPDELWRVIASGRIEGGEAAPAAPSLDAIRERCAQTVDVDGYYRRLARLGLAYGPLFQGIETLTRGAGEVLATVRLPEGLRAEAGRYLLHPALLDACLQVLGAALLDVDGAGIDHSYVLAGISRFCLYEAPGESLTVHAVLRQETAGAVAGDVVLLGESGAVVAEANGVRVQRVQSASLRRAGAETADWFYSVEWEAVPDVAGSGVPIPEFVVDLASIRASFQLDRYEALLPEFDALAGAWARAALRKLNWEPGRTRAELGVGAEYEKLFARMLQMLGEDEAVRRRPDADPEPLHAGLVSKFPACEAELTLLKRCGQQLAEVLQGKVGALPVLFPDGSLRLLEKAYAEEPFACAGNRVLVLAMQEALRAMPEGRPVRILEIGAGTGGTTSSLLPELAADRVEYTFTDVSQLFLRKAREKFREYGYVTYKLLDIERDPAEQSFDGQRFDIVVAANVLHATRELKQTLRHVRQLLAPEGRLMLLEGTAPQRKTDLIFGLTPGWWRFTDADLRPAHALLPAREWVALLANEGFGTAQAIPAPGLDVASPWSVLLTRPAAEAGGWWLVVGDGAGLARKMGVRTRRIADGDGEFEVPAECLGVLHLGALDGGDSQSLCESALRCVQRLATLGSSKARLWLVTQGAQAAAVSADGLAGAALWGLGRVAANEHPEIWGGLVDLDPAISAAGQAGALLALVGQTDPPRQAALRNGRIFVPRLTTRPKPAGAAVRLCDDGAYLVTGGLGGLGLMVARWLAGRGARQIVLCGRSGPTAEALAVIEELRQGGAAVMTAQTDVASREQVAALLNRITSEMAPLRGVLHAAGVYDDGMLLQQNAARFAPVLAAKADGAWNLHTLTAGSELDFFVLFSSASALMGAPGQGNYAAGNAYLDALAHYRRGAGLPALSINWGPWSGVGEAARMSAAAQKRLAGQGIGSMAPALALDCLEVLLAGAEPQAAVLPVQWETYLRQFEGATVPPLLARMAARAQAEEAPARESWRERISAAEEGERGKLILAMVQQQARTVLGIERTVALNPLEPLQSLGLDSLMTVELRNGLSKAIGRPLPSTLVFDYPTITAIAKYLQQGERGAEAQAPKKTRVQAGPERLNATEPIAILGAGCRIPGGANDLASFWELLRSGTDAVIEVPADRWNIDDYYDPDPEAPGKMYTRLGGFLGPVDQFDAAFFGITPREAVSMDPQQRLLLETAWEALESAGQSADRLKGSQTGVFIGISAYDYYHLQRSAGQAGIDAYTGSGVTFSVAAGRIAYVLGLQGPAMAVDTACSSSMVTTHLACQSLRNQECDLALAGGVNLILSPENTIYSCRLHALAADGHCKTFDARANGYVRGEGCGVVVLKRLRDALRDGDPILAVIRGSAVNQDGRSNGLTAPNGPAQEAVIRKALQSGGVRPEDVAYVEAHGTGTPLGDPIELQALGAVLGAGRAVDRPLIVGSLKTNIGHLESAAGITSLMKAALVVNHGEIPAHLHFIEGNPFIPWSDLPISIPVTMTPWPGGAGWRIAGVSSFGYSGTNAHAILEQPPEQPGSVSVPDGQTQLLVLSARSGVALRALAVRYESWLGSCSGTAADIAYSAAVRRSHHEHRLAVTGATAAEFAENLQRFVDGRPGPGCASGVSVPGQVPQVVFTFPGQGSQWLGMGRELLASEVAFRTAMEECDAAIGVEAGWSVLAELAAGEGESRLSEINVVQPMLFAMQVALARQWQAWGVQPDAVTGHSMGEVAAAHIAGALSLEDAVKVICRRSRLLTRVAGRGAMAVVELSAEDAAQAISGSDGALSVAVCNSPRSTVLAGDPAALQELLDTLEARGVFCRRVKVDVASHSRYVDELRDDLLLALADLAPRATRIPMYSTVTGELVEGTRLDGGYWARNLREPVLFGQTIAALLEENYSIFVEVSPHPVLVPAVDDTIRHAGREGTALPSMRRGEPERASLLATLGALYTKGCAMEWSRVYTAGRYEALPTYAWDRQRYWISDHAIPVMSPAQGQRMLGAHIASSVQPGTHIWEQELSLDALPYLKDHRVQGMVVLPAAAYLDMALQGAFEAFGAGMALEEAVFDQMLVFPEGGWHRVQLVITEGSTFQILSEADGWRRHAYGKLRAAKDLAYSQESIAAIQARCPEVSSGAELYAGLAARGLEYGPAFQGIEQVWSGEGEALGLVHLPRVVWKDRQRQGIHPALLDACFHGMGMAIGGENAGRLYVPVALDSLQIVGDPMAIRWSHVRLVAVEPDGVVADIGLLDEAGNAVAVAMGLRVKALEQTAAGGSSDSGDWLYELQWVDCPRRPAEPAAAGHWLILADGTGVGTAVAEGLRARGETVEVVFEQALDIEGFRTLMTRQGGCKGVVNLWCLDAPENTHNAGVLSTLFLIQALAGTGWRNSPRVWIVTRGAHAMGANEVPTPGQAPVWGLGRTVSYEHPEFVCTKVDLDPQAAGADMLLEELLAADREDQIILRAGARYAARLRRWTPESAPEVSTAAGEQCFRLEQRTPGVLDGLSLRAFQLRQPGPGEVLIEVLASGLNFLDVLLALNAIPNDVAPEAGMSLGSECSGRIVALGDGVAGLEVGQDVLAIAAWALGSHAIAPAELVIAKPALLSHNEAATIPVAFLTAYYSLYHVARLAKGERVLIHAAAGGVGLAAVQLAQRIGAEIFATAGSEDKRERLRTLGVAHVMDSRSLSFAAQVREATGGEGVDVVLNSLAGDFIDVSLDLLKDHGRFVEIGKRDYYANRPLGLKPFLRNLSFSLVDLRGMIGKRPGYVRELLLEVARLFATGELKPLEHTVFAAAETPDAFRWMAQARHTGKIVISWLGREQARIAAGDRPAVRAERSYLITGGMGGLGLLTARWLVEQGARHVALLGRSAATAEAESAMEAMRGLGAEVRPFRADVADAESLSKVLAAMDENMPPLAGIFHCAGLLDDGLLEQLNAARFAKVAAPKIAGSWNLHLLTKDRQLDYFVLYSSGSSLLGAPGQGNYAAANAFLDALAHYRRAQGLAAISVNWGAWAEVGLAAAEANRGDRMARGGFSSIPPEEGLKLLGEFLRKAPVQVGVLPLNLRQWRQSFPQLADTPLFQDLLQELGSDAAKGQASSVRAAIVQASASERLPLLENHVTEQLALVVRLKADRIERQVSFQSLGLDSLMALELRNRLEANLGLTLPVTMVWGYPNVAALSAYLLSGMNLPGAAAEIEAKEPEAVSAAPLQERIAELSDDEVDRLFAARLSAREGAQ